MSIKTAILPVAGLGTRFLPITKSIPKEMLPIIDKPLIQYAVDEAVAAGIEHIIFVTSSTKRSIEDYFDHNYELEKRLTAAKKQQALEVLNSTLPDKVSFSYIRQRQPRGLGDAILTAKSCVADEPVAILLSDDFISSGGALLDMVAAYNKQAGNYIAVETITADKTEQYGIAAFDAESRIHTLVEKPSAADAPSLSGVIGRYILQPAIFDYLSQQSVGVGGELQLTDAIAAMLVNTPTYAHTIRQRRFDCGSKRGYLEAILYQARQDPELKSLCESIVSVD